jgi:hypothetical protein
MGVEAIYVTGLKSRFCKDVCKDIFRSTHEQC